MAWTEAEGEPFEGKCAVVEVEERRRKHHYMSDGTVAGTIALRYQFSALNDDKADNMRLIKALKIDSNDPAVADCIRAVQTVLTAGYQDLVPGAVTYLNPKTATNPPKNATPANLVKVIGNHAFYRDPTGP
jgi:spore germination cell wall hydrolase CwlJ-like protein